MNRDNLQAVRNAIAAAEPDLIDMSQIGQPTCGSPGCIIGWASSGAPAYHPEWAAMNPEWAKQAIRANEEARRFLDMPNKQFDNLTLGNSSFGELKELAITKDEVLTAIDSLLEDPDRIMPAWPERVLEYLEE